MINYQECLLTYLPGTQWSLSGNDLSTLIFHDKTEKPTEDQFIQWQTLIDNQKILNEYQLKRASEYPSLQDLTIALWEQIIENRPDSAIALQKLRMDIKTKYPKPS